MSGLLLLSGVVWLCLVSAVIMLLISRIAAAHRDHGLMSAGAGAANPLHIHLRHLVCLEDRLGVILTICTAVWTLIFAVVLADDMVGTIIHRIVHAFAFS